MSKIEWTDTTWNPVTGCDKISAGCQNCYAEKMAHRHKDNPKMKGKYKNEFKVTCHPEELKRFWQKKPQKIFVNSMSDLFHPDIPEYFVYEIIKKIKRNPRHIFQILTKRPERISAIQWPDNVWMGITIENEQYLPRLNWLKIVNAKTKFISFEPLLESVGIPDLSGIDWVIVGAETGPGARHMDVEWAQEIRRSCWRWEDEGDHIPFFFKKVSKGDTCPDDLNVRQFPGAK